MSELSPLSGVKRKSYFRAAKTVDDPTRTSAPSKDISLDGPDVFQASSLAGYTAAF
jgi:hypothetical protein